MLTRQYVFALVFILCPAWSIAAELWQPTPSADNPYNIIPTFNNSDDPIRRGNLYVSAKSPWFDTLTVTERVKGRPRFAEVALRFRLGLLRLPLYVRPEAVSGVRQPMTPHQTSLLRAYAAANPDNADAQARADIAEFERGCQWLTDNGVDLVGYVGSPILFERKGNEDIATWHYRLRKELEPITRHVKAMAYDATMGKRPVHGEWQNRALQFYFDRLHGDGMRTLCEPSWYEGDWDMFADSGQFIDEDTLASWEEKNPEAATAFPPRKPNATFVGDPSGLVVPGINGAPVFLWCDFKDPAEKADPLAYIKRLHDRWPHAWLCISWQNIPLELLN